MHHCCAVTDLLSVRLRLQRIALQPLDLPREHQRSKSVSASFDDTFDVHGSSTLPCPERVTETTCYEQIEFNTLLGRDLRIQSCDLNSMLHSSSAYSPTNEPSTPEYRDL